MSAPDTGNSATIVFATSLFAVDITRIGSLEFNQPIINSSHLGTTLRESYVKGDLDSIDPFDFDYWFDPQLGTATLLPPMATMKNAVQAAEVITLTWPIQGTDTAGLKLIGSGFMNHTTLPEFLNNTPQSGTCSVQFAGGTAGPLWTNPVAAA